MKRKWKCRDCGVTKEIEHLVFAKIIACECGGHMRPVVDGESDTEEENTDAADCADETPFFDPT
jgi:hypothetical protein